jgi:hypothetical protein
MLIPKVTWKLAAAIILTIAIIIFATNRILAGLYRGPRQPVPFSHWIHVSTKQISCFYCHQYASVSQQAGIPAVAKCMQCHRIIASNFPPIAKVRWYYNRNEPIPWVRVNRLADYVHFNHQAHIAYKVDCSECHGNVAEMDRVKPVHRFKMQFCIDCHDKNQVSVNCYTCHW